MTIEYMKTYDMYRVRGGGLCQVDPRQLVSRYNTVSRARTVEPGSNFYDPIYEELAWLRQQEW
ncbi:hypothetical protein QFZ60_001566 [Arthrobacter sp. B2I5]|uniref:hypothetical protein n=1 Tax=Arthrobacter sp. B2I5 TaxID=3042266 RepID=UPI00277D674B|nr:hypothetical protein [Arthrobacter sp. B2I5]MDQ0825393.1 hypothetical protein [Arthrobacter sp. B2I5]